MSGKPASQEKWYVRSAEGDVYGPTDRATLVSWAEEGRIDPTGFVSEDRKEWMPAQLMPDLEMKWIVEAEPGRFYGPFNRAAVVRFAASGAIPGGASIYRRHDLPVDKDPDPVVVEKIVEKVVEVVPPARSAIVEPQAAEAVAARPPEPAFGGIFKGADRARMQALEAAARRELAAARRSGASPLGRMFFRRDP